MKKLLSWQVVLGVVLISLSVIGYCIHYLIFHDLHHIFLYLVGDIAFVFFEVFLVTLVLHELLSMRDKKTLLNKLNMVIGAFFSEVGLGLLKSVAASDGRSAEVSRTLVVNNAWTAQEFKAAHAKLKGYEYSVDIERIKLQDLKSFLTGRRDFLLRLLENPNLLEHESFTNLLWAVFHLTEELSYRNELQGLSEADKQHIAGDIKRVYQLLIGEWLDYMRHLQRDYPYLFSLAIRTNSFDPAARVEIK
jgi:hypothetical protein